MGSVLLRAWKPLERTLISTPTPAEVRDPSVPTTAPRAKIDNTPKLLTTGEAPMVLVNPANPALRWVLDSRASSFGTPPTPNP